MKILISVLAAALLSSCLPVSGQITYKTAHGNVSIASDGKSVKALLDF